MEQVLQRGVPTKLLDAATVSAGDLSAVFGLPISKASDGVITLTWRTLFAADPTAIQIDLQIAMNNVAAEFATIDSTTYITGGELRIIAPIFARFIRAKVTAKTGGGATTVEVMI